MTARIYGWKRDLPDKRDRYYLHRTTGALPTRVDLRNGMPPIYDQGDIGSCTANAWGAALHALEMGRGNLQYAPSRLAIYWLERSYDGTTSIDNGSYLRTGAKTLSHYGAPDESLWPYDTSRFTQKPPKSALIEGLNHRVSSYERVSQNRDARHRAMAEGYRICFGFTVYESLETQAVAKTGFIPMPDFANERVLGGHAGILVGYDDALGCDIWGNSWGPWGDHGYGYMPYDYVDDPDLASDFWILKELV